MTTKIDTTQEANSNTLTEGIRVECAAQYLPQESDPDRRRYFYVYRIRISNEGESPARLLSRHWVILDAQNRREDVEGPGVVGKQPHLAPGESFEYTSYCPLPTEWGTMEGSYTFERKLDERFEAKVGRFFLVPTVDNSFVTKS